MSAYTNTRLVELIETALKGTSDVQTLSRLLQTAKAVRERVVKTGKESKVPLHKAEALLQKVTEQYQEEVKAQAAKRAETKHQAMLARRAKPEWRIKFLLPKRCMPLLTRAPSYLSHVNVHSMGSRFDLYHAKNHIMLAMGVTAKELQDIEDFAQHHYAPINWTRI